MTVQQSALRCKDGDLAVVINDTIDCRQNIGHIVQIRGPVRMLKQSGMLGWRIKPLHKRVWGVTEFDGRSVKELVFWSSGVFHEDAWLMPIRPQSPDEVWLELQQEIDQSQINIGAVVPMDVTISLSHESEQAMRSQTAQDQDELLPQDIGKLKTRCSFETVIAKAERSFAMPATAYDPLEQVLRDNPTLTREKAEEMAHAFGF